MEKAKRIPWALMFDIEATVLSDMKDENIILVLTLKLKYKY